MASAVRSIPKGLSGVEAMESIIEKVRERLIHHDRFAPHKSYQGYEARVKVEFYPAASFAPPLTDDFTVSNHAPDAIVSDAAIVDETINIPLRPPNQVRVEAGMKTPVQAPDGRGGTTEKWISKGKPPKDASGKFAKRAVPQGERKKESLLNVPGSGVKMVSAAEALSSFPAHQQTTISETEDL